ncbi:MAG: citrate synthase [Polyangiales bacterium]
MPRGPSGFDNQPDWLDATAAVALLGVKRDTLYAYVSRGLVRRSGARGHHRYAREDLLRLKARHDARAGHGPVAAGALRWGEAVLTSEVSSLHEDGPRYRGVALAALLAEDVSFERVAALLTTGALPEAVEEFPTVAVPTVEGAPLTALARLLARGLEEPDDDWIALSRNHIARFGAHLGARLGSTVRRGPLAARVLGETGARARCLDRALVIVAEHELNPSSFAARVAASAGAGLTACLLAAAATMTGPRHGRMSDALEEILADDDPTARLRDLAARGEAVPGFGHPMYPQGDPRAAALLAMSASLGLPGEAGARFSAALALLQAHHHAPPNLDAGLVALRIALGLPRGFAAGIFALGRMAGWTAHALEQRRDGSPLRPRASPTRGA